MQILSLKFLIFLYKFKISFEFVIKYIKYLITNFMLRLLSMPIKNQT